MLRGFRLLLWLRARHARTFLLRLAHFAGSDPSVDRGVGERVYQLYAAAALGVVAVLMWSLVLDTVEEACAAAGPSLMAAVAPAILLVPLVTFAYAAVRGLRGQVLRLSRPDIAYVAAGSMGSRAIVADATGASALAAAVCGAAAGYLLGAGLAAGLGAGLPGGPGAQLVPLAVAFATGALCAAAVGAAQVAGVVGLAVPARLRRRVRLACAAAVAVLCVAGAASSLPLAPALVATGTPGFAALGWGALAALVAQAAALAALAPRMDMTAVAEQSALVADLDPFGPFSPLDPGVQRDYRRRVKIARRGPRSRLPAASGRGALVARAALSLARQHEGLPLLIMLGACVTPLGVTGLLGTGVPVTLLFWLMMLVLMQPSPPHEASRAFRDDIRVRLTRDRLPFGTLELLVLDSLPAFMLVTLVTCAAMPFALPAGAPLGAALALGVLANAAALLCAGLEAVRLYSGGPRPWSEGGLMAFVAVTGAVSLTGQPWLVVAAAAAVCAAVAAIVRFGAEAG